MSTAPGLADYGTDLFGVDDLDALGRDVTGVDVLRQAIARRLITPRGMLLDDPNYGYNVRAELSSAVDRGRLLQIASKVKAEVLKDPRILTCSVNATLSGAPSAQVIKLHIDGQARQGPYDLVVTIDKVTTTLLQGGAT